MQAVDTDSDYPTKGLPTKRINALNPSVEAIVGVCKVTAAHPSAKPDLVIIAFNSNGIKQKLTALGIKVDRPGSAHVPLGVLTHRSTQLGALTGHATNADAIATSMKTTIAADVASVPKHPRQDAQRRTTSSITTYYSLTSTTFVGSLLKSTRASPTSPTPRYDLGRRGLPAVERRSTS